MNAPERITVPTNGHEQLPETTQRLQSKRLWEEIGGLLALKHPGDFDALLAVKAVESEHGRLHDSVYPLTRKWFVLLKAWKAWERAPTAEATNNLKAAFTTWENHPERPNIEQDTLYSSLARKASELLIVVESANDIRRTVSSL